ncbi:hypothetical protein FF124_09895 [Martelella lutilitoris]|uniref:Uncharacterized protein n=1 Tax=Martelella lutilitoris TaxID=2583532 RepID=A0A5C4JRP2_9HYPH|nr:hypothetical protein [Martelella lutilitoris]TNB47892.1 hypothetical protein FF124_09895 [Martelella lutilitoris]
MSSNQLTDLETALESLAGAGFVIGPEWEAVHEICQAHEGEMPYDAAHALCHRIEGDTWNAGYWYRRAKKTVPQGSFADEYAGLKAEIAVMR